MKKILFITDCSLKQCHSIRDILYSLLNHDDIKKYKHVILNAYRSSRNYFQKDHIEGYKTYFVPEINKESITNEELSIFAALP